MQQYIESIDFSEYYGQYGYDLTKNYIQFYGNKGQDLFGNFWRLPKKISYNGVSANTVETLYHAAKFSQDIAIQFDDLEPLQAFYLSRKFKNQIRLDWNDVKENVMLDLLRIKFSIPMYTIVLLATGSRYLVEHNLIKGRDDYWSDNHDGSGKNRLGILLMKIREEFFGCGIVDKQQ